MRSGGGDVRYLTTAFLSVDQFDTSEGLDIPSDILHHPLQVFIHVRISPPSKSKHIL